ncbi:T9SS type A sorting domain-containing protein [candidate division WOR-3 bacterium]|nr:T9SS type A sorting domain-containing protein [candidate division WOR-3 bacterium]
MKIFMFLIFPLILLAQDNYVFGPSIMVNDDAPGAKFHVTTQRSIGCRGDTIYLVWRDDRFGNPLWYNSRVFFSKSTDAGDTWSPNLMISVDSDTLWGSRPHLTLDALGNIYIAYRLKNDNTDNQDIYFTKSTDGGDSFSSPIMVNDSVEVLYQDDCAIAVDSSGQNVYIVWEDKREPLYEVDIYFAHSTDGGTSFLPSMRVNDDDSAMQWHPVITCDETGQNVYVAWMDNRDTLHGWDVYFSRSTDYGQTFEPNYLISDTTTTGGTVQGYPSIYYKNDIIYLVWRDQSNGYCVQFAKSTDNGLSFGPQVLVPDDPDAYGGYPSISADDSGKVCVVWKDARDYITYGHDIYFAFSSDKGQSFNQNVLVNDHLGVVDAQDNGATICVNESGKVFVAWRSDRNDQPYGNSDIYFARGTYVGIEEDAGRLTPDAIRLDVYPNPFSKLINISFGVGMSSEGMELTIKIYDVSGRLVKNLSLPTVYSLVPTVVWRGDDDFGHKMPVGIYFIELMRGEDRYVKKVIKIE